MVALDEQLLSPGAAAASSASTTTHPPALAGGSWWLVLDSGAYLPLDTDSLVLGREPASADDGTALADPDATSAPATVHARLDRTGDVWTITDLGSTEGVLVGGGDGDRTLAAGETAEVTGRFVLGELGMRIERSER